MMKFEIINPSVKAFICGDDFRIVCLATAALGDGKYGLKQVGGGLSMPVLLFAKTWLEDTFKESAHDLFKKDIFAELITVLNTVHLEGEQTSMNDIIGYAKKLVISMEHTLDHTQGE